MTTQEFIKKYSPIAIWEHIKSGVPASITLAQGIIESNSGNSELATNYNNFFGIKGYDNPNGYPLVYYTDDLKDEPFVSYPSATAAFKDHINFLKRYPRYQRALDTTNYTDFANELQLAGYATSAAYASTLINTINDNNLGRFDFWGSHKYIIAVILLLVLASIIFAVNQSTKRKTNNLQT